MIDFGVKGNNFCYIVQANKHSRSWLCTQCLKLLVHGAHKDVLYKFKEATELFRIAILGLRTRFAQEHLLTRDLSRL